MPKIVVFLSLVSHSGLGKVVKNMDVIYLVIKKYHMQSIVMKAFFNEAAAMVYAGMYNSANYETNVKFVVQAHVVSK